MMCSIACLCTVPFAYVHTLILRHTSTAPGAPFIFQPHVVALSHKSLCDKTVRSRVRSPQMPPIVTSLCSPRSYSLGTGPSQRAVTWGLRILDKGENGLKGAARTRGLQFCSINLYAHATQLSAQIAEWHVLKDLCDTRAASRASAAGV